MVGHVWAAISTTTEMIAFIAVDFLFKMVFGFWLLSSYKKNAEFQFEITGYWSEGISADRHVLLDRDDE